jgi:hypothetical protein
LRPNAFSPEIARTLIMPGIKKPLENAQAAFWYLAPHRGHISNFLPGAFARGQGGFREYSEITDILNLGPG